MRWIWEYLNAFNLENNTELELAHGDVTPRAHSFLEVPLHAISFSVILLVERYVLVNTEETRVSQHGFARCKETTKHQDRGESVPIIEFPPSPDMVRRKTKDTSPRQCREKERWYTERHERERERERKRERDWRCIVVSMQQLEGSRL